MFKFSKKYPTYRQLDFMDCGPTCLKMVAAAYDKTYSLDFLRANSYITKNGVSLLGLSEAAEKIGFRTLVAKLSIQQLTDEVPLPAILHWNQEHFVVLHDIKESFWKREEQFIIGDPAHGLVIVDKTTFKKCWLGTGDEKGIALLLETTPDFYQKEEENSDDKAGFLFLFKYLKPYKFYLSNIILGMLFGSLISMIFPFLTQSLVDYGINRQNVSFIHLILLSQLLLFAGSVAVDMIRNWILLHISSRVSVSIISNFLIKLMKLPISFFESKNVGDISQRINDHHRVETFLTGATLDTLFSLVNLIVFSIILSIYNTQLLLVFMGGSLLSIIWVTIFLKQRKSLDYNRFQRSRENQNSIYELITGMQEIKLYNCERPRRWEWERIQAKLFKINIKGLALEQYQEIGSSFFTQLKNIIISYITAQLVLNQQITLGTMLSISYIIGQMNGPLSQLMQFIRSIQDAKMSLDRLGEIHNKEDEENEDGNIKKMHGFQEDVDNGSSINKQLFINSINKERGDGITLFNLSFRYGGSRSPLVLKNINMHIPKGKVTAIVGSSGSGKTTLLKLLLKFYPSTEGEIMVDNVNLEDISAKLWRSNCGTVMQDGYIFSDTIARNIAVDGLRIDEERLLNAVNVANVSEYVKKLPLGFTTRIGNSGSSLSGGQKQRIFIARAVYKDPKYMFFDEATSALDSNNEKIIMENMDTFYEGRTVVVIAHRLSTVKNADQIIVLQNGEVVEQGNHKSLTSQKGYYYELVKNQLELGAA